MRTATSFLAVAFLSMAPGARAQMAVEYYHLDAVGTVLAVTNEAGALVEEHDYDVFGQEVGAQAGTQPKRFAGKDRDGETGWDYFGARYYGSKVGRFTTTDPVYTWKENLLDPQRWNRYAYSRNNPLRYVDPDGRKIVLQENASAALQQQYASVKAYLAVSGADFVLKALDARAEVVTIRETSGLGEHADEFDPASNTIYWNPYAALVTSSGGSLSPATMLSHEADHALDWLLDPVGHAARSRETDAQFERAEERRVIQGSEAKVAQLKGEDRRNDHKGNYVHVESAIDRPKRPE